MMIRLTYHQQKLASYLNSLIATLLHIQESRRLKKMMANYQNIEKLHHIHWGDYYLLLYFIIVNQNRSYNMTNFIVSIVIVIKKMK